MKYEDIELGVTITLIESKTLSTIPIAKGNVVLAVNKKYRLANIGGHVDVTVLGALQVDQHGNLANWMIPGKS